MMRLYSHPCRIISAFATLAALFIGSPIAQAQSLNGTATNNATTQSQSGATNAGNAQNITFQNQAASDHTSATLRTTPSIVGPGLYGSFSSDSCTVSGGGGGSVVGLGLNFGVPVKDDECNSRRNATLLMQVANNVRPFDRATADRISRAALNVLCRSDNDVYAALDTAGLCDSIDYDAYKRENRQPPANRTASIARGPALAYYPNTGGQ